MPAPRFTDNTLRFLRNLKRHNDRDWFRSHREEFERDVRGPMVEVVQRLADDLPRFAPELIAAPKTSIYRIYRDTRFSADKSPFKTHVAAIFPHRALPKHVGAGLYLHVAPDHVLIGAGSYAPEPRQLYRLREHVARNLKQFRTIVESPTFRKSFGEVGGERLKRVPKGFEPDHPAASYLKLRQFLAGAERPAQFATGPRFYSSLIRLFEQLAPFVRFLNDPLRDSRAPERDLLSATE